MHFLAILYPTSLANLVVEVGTTVKCHYNAVFGVQEIDRVIAVTAL